MANDLLFKSDTYVVDRMSTHLTITPDSSPFTELEPDKVSNPNPNDDVSDLTDDKYVPSNVPSYFTEAAISSKQRNALSDDDFGLPRTRMYPLTDGTHVRQAIRLFGHCRDPKDREVLAGNIFKAMKKHKVSMKIHKRNPLYMYAPQALQETNTLPDLTIDGSSMPMRERTQEDIIKEHLRVNGSYYNNIFYGEDYRKAVVALKNFEFMKFFYPNLTRMNFVTRLHCVCGGLASPENANHIYEELKLRAPADLEFSKPLGWYEVKTDKDADDVATMLVNTDYDADSNWFRVDLSDDLNHIFYCLRLYSIMGEIFLDPGFNPEIHLSAEHTAILLDWCQHVSYHYDLYLDATDETEKMRQRQYLWDLYWLYTDNPHDENSITVNIISMLHNMACVTDQVININEANTLGEMISKDQCSGYLVHDLGMSDDFYLLPTTLQYPIIDKSSVRLAMDMIDRIDKEDRDEYIKNLNRKYKEFGCTFSISVDHPYAKYADKAIIVNMTHILLEGDTSVDDEGTSAGLTDKLEQPFYKRVDYMKGNLQKNLAQIKDAGPSDNSKQDPNFEWQGGLV